MNITKDNYEEVKEELKRYEEKTKTLENIVHFGMGFLNRFIMKQMMVGMSLQTSTRTRDLPSIYLLHIAWLMYLISI